MWQKLVKLYHRLGSPKGFYTITQTWALWLTIVIVPLLVAGLVLGLLYAPADYQQGNSFRIIYIHVPAALVAQTTYIMMAVCGAFYLIWRMKLAAWAAMAIAPVGASFCLIALLTGAIWGKPTWGTYWIWDARLTSMLVLLFLYLGVISLRQSITNEVISYKACAILSLVGLVNIPIIKYSVQWWNTLHQGVTLTLTRKPDMHPDMLLPLILMIIAMYLLFGVVTLMRVRNHILWFERKKRWARELLEK